MTTEQTRNKKKCGEHPHGWFDTLDKVKTMLKWQPLHLVPWRLSALMAICIITVSLPALSVEINLDGGEVTATDLTADYVNNSGTPGVLVFDNSSAVAFTGSVGTNITVRKTGEGKLTWTPSSVDTTLSSITITAGTFEISSTDTSKIGSGFIYLNGGELSVTADVTLRQRIQLKNNSRISVASDKMFIVDAGRITTTGYTLTKVGTGILHVEGTNYNNVNSRWIIEEGRLRGNRDTFVSHVGITSTVIEIHENGTVESTGHHPLPEVIMRGGLLWNTGNISFASGTSTDNDRWPGAFSFRQKLTVLPSLNGTPSRIFGDRAYMGHGGLTPIFDVQEGAILQMESFLQYGFNASNSARTDGAFVKTGKGEMTLFDDVEIKGTIHVDDGILRVKKGVRIAPDATIETTGDGKVVLDDGAVLTCSVRSVPAVLADAAVWIDATRSGAAEGAELFAIPNFGTARGSFVKFTTGTIPNAPKYISSGIGGKPSFDFDGGQELVLNAYTNRTNQLTIFGVVKRTTYHKWSAWIGLSSAGCAQNDYEGAGTVTFSDTGETDLTIGNQYNNQKITVSGSAPTDVAVIDFFEDSYSNRTVTQYSETGVTATGTVTANGANYNIDLISIGGRLAPRGSAIFSGKGNSRSCTYCGQIGEVIVFSRVLTEAEKADIETYLKGKWFGDETANRFASSPFAVSVPTGTAAIVSSSGEITKSGEGQLLIGDASNANGIIVEEGTLSLLPTSIVNRVAVWMDADDASTLTVNDGKVTQARNKGSAGGVFEKANHTDIRYPVLSTGMNGRNCLSFDGNAALLLSDYINTNADWRIAIYIAGKLSPEANLVDRIGKGRWAGMFSMSRVSASGTDNNHQNAIHFEECVDGTTTNANLYIANNYGGSYFNAKNISPAAGVPYIFLIQAGVNSVSYGFYTGDGKLKAYKTGRAQRVAAYNIDRVQLGGRLKDGAAPQWSGIGNTSNNMYLGDIGEFMVFDRLLADEEQTAVLDYLKTKWLVANGEPETPAVLAPVSLAPTFGGSTELSLSEGTTFESHVATQPLASFTANGAATLVRNGVTDPGTYAFFNVAGDVTLPLTMALIAESAPPQTATLIGYSGSLNTSDTAWTIQADKAGWRISNIPNRIRFVRDTGLMILVR